MSIAKVEPLTTARALRGPVRLPAARAARRGRGRHRCSRSRSAASGCSASSSSSPSAARCRRAAGRADRGARGRRRRGAGRARALGRARVLLDPGARARARAAAGDRRRPAGRPRRAPRPRPRSPRPASAALDGTGLGPLQRRALELLTATGAELAARRARRRRASAATRCGGSSAAAWSSSASAEVPRRPRVGGDRRRPAAASSSTRPSGRRSSGSSPALDGEAARELLLHGVTGSGKTEVYLAAAEAALERGRGVIVLVPEIGMTPQTVSRFAARFGDRVAVLHSRLGAGERRDEWHRLRDGEARICVGPALGGLRADRRPRADRRRRGARRLLQAGGRPALRRPRGRPPPGAATPAPPWSLGSATPRPESWLELERIELPSRVDGRPLPAVEVLDMRGRDGREGPLHPRTREALAALAEARREGDRADQPPRLGAAT